MVSIVKVRNSVFDNQIISCGYFTFCFVELSTFVKQSCCKAIISLSKACPRCIPHGLQTLTFDLNIWMTISYTVVCLVLQRIIKEPFPSLCSNSFHASPFRTYFQHPQFYYGLEIRTIKQPVSHFELSGWTIQDEVLLLLFTLDVIGRYPKSASIKFFWLMDCT